MMTKQTAAQSFDEATARFLAQCGALSPADWTFRPQPHEWSMGDVAEHLSIANRGILARLSKTLLESPMAGRSADVIDDEIPYLFYRGDEPPNVATPTGAWTSWAECEAVFREHAERLSVWARETDADLRRYGVPHPVFGLLDGVQWLLFAAAHTERHRSQIIGLQRRVPS
jgi:hypothetical protein